MSKGRGGENVEEAVFEDIGKGAEDVDGGTESDVEQKG